MPCNAGATCTTGTHKCLVNELAAVGVYFDINAGGKDWTKGPDA